jgi:RNA polymerase sigma factor for flagellar operon FliA
MFDRQFLPPLHAAAAVGGSVVVRPAARIFAETATGQVVEPLVKSSVELGMEHASTAGPGPGDGPPQRPDARRDAERRAREEAAEAALLEAEATRLIEAADANAVAPDAAEAAEADAEETDAGSAEVTDSPTAAPIAEGEEAVDLTGYGAYGKTQAGALGMSRDELVTRYAHLVKYVVGRLGVSVPGLFDHEDAMQAGVLGLLRAIDAYKPEAAASFESYAILRIRGAILDAVRSLDTVGRAGREAARAIQGAIRDLQHELGRSPTEVEIAGRLNMPVTRYRERLQAASVVTVSLDEHDARDNDDDSVMLADQAPDPNAVDPAEEAARRDAIAGLVAEIGRLGQRSRLVLALYYQDEMTFKEIGQVLGVTESRVCQIHTEAILALRGRLVDSDVAARLRRRRGR